ncbi:MAG: AAA family ATPase [Isosphaeraceae bacterium]
MLIEFRVENHRSLRDEQVLTMESGRVGDDTDSRPRRIPGYAESLLPVAALYGANASGKSNVLAALAFLREAVILSHRSWLPDEGVPRDPFAWGPKRNEPSLFEVTFLSQGVRYQYGCSASDECFLEEWLHAWPNNKKQVWFERDGNVFKFGENLKGENKVIEGVTRSNALFLSAAAQLKHPQLTGIFSWFRSLEMVNVLSGSGRPIASRELPREKWLARSLYGGAIEVRQRPTLTDGMPTQPFLDRFRDLLRSADFGILDLRLGQSESDDLPGHLGSLEFQLKHQSEVDDAWLPLEDESRGTQTLFRLASRILQVFEERGILLVDELEASLHPALAQQIVRQFNDPVSNARNAQLIFTTHDTNLLGTTLGEPALRRDQVWLTEKDNEGATVLYPLTDYKPRKAENLERGYLQGRYGAIPFLGDFHLAGETSATAQE